jgi:hypothetical protein
MKRRFFLLLAFACGCFGEGPTPTQPTGVTIVFYVSRPEVQCGQLASYIGPVALGDSVGFAAVLPYLPPSSCNNGGSNNGESVAVPVYRFTTMSVAAPEPLETPTQATFGPVPIVVGAHGTDGAWAYLGAQMSGAPPIKLGGSVQLDLAAPMTEGTATPAGMVMDGTHTFVITRDTTASVSSDPSYPCCPGNNISGPTTSNAWRVTSGATDYMTAMTSEPFYRESLATPITQNTQSIFFTTRVVEPLGQVKLKKLGKDDPASTVPVEIDAIAQGLVPVGLAANDDGLVVAVSTFSRASFLAPRCQIIRYPTTGSMETLLDTDAFTCQDVAIDATHAYFAIVSLPMTSNNGGPYGMRGRGIGRVSLALPHTVETVDIGIDAQSEGPRRVFLAGDDLFAVTPFEIAKLPTSALAGKTDFSP